MTYLPSARDFAAYIHAPATSDLDLPRAERAERAEAATSRGQAGAEPRRGIWGRILHSIWTSRQRQADREIARYLALNGGKLTDSVEREIMRRLSGDGNYRL